MTPHGSDGKTAIKSGLLYVLSPPIIPNSGADRWWPLAAAVAAEQADSLPIIS